MLSRITLVLAIATICSSLTAQRVPEIRVDSNATLGFMDKPAIEVVGRSVFVAWHDDRNGLFTDIFFNRSFDGGATWMANDVRLDSDAPGTADSLDVQVAAWGDFVYVVWQDFRNGGSSIRFNRSADRGTTWLPHDVLIAANVAPATGSPQICELANRVVITWADERASFGRSDIYARLSTDFGATWHDEVRLNSNAPGTTNPEFPSIDMDGPFVYVAWEDDTRTGTTEGIYLNRSADGGVTWEPVDLQLDDNSVESENPVVACLGQNVSVAWEGNSSTDIFCISSSDGGVTWMPSAVRVNTEPITFEWSIFPKIDVEGSRVYVAWDDRRNGRWEPFFNYSWDGGQTFSPSDQRLNANLPMSATSDARNVQIHSDGDHVHAVWKDFRQGAAQVYYNRSSDGGATFVADVPLSGSVPTNSVDWPRIEVDQGVPVVVWDTGQSVQFNIPFGWLRRGVGTSGSGGFPPLLTVQGLAMRGESVSVDTTFGLSNASSALLIGFSPANQLETPLFGGTLLVNPQFTAPAMLDTQGSSSFGLNISTDPVWLGVNLNFQSVVLDPGAPAGLSMSAAVELWIG